MLFGFDTKKKKILTILTLIMLVGTAFLSGSVLALPPATWADQPTYIGPGTMIQDGTYIIDIDSAGATYAKDGKTGQVVYRAASSAEVVQYAVDSIGSYNEHIGKIIIKSGYYQWDDQVDVPTTGGHITITGEGYSTILNATGTFDCFFRILGSGIGQTVTIENMFMHGKGTAGGIWVEGNSWAYLNDLYLWFCVYPIRTVTEPVTAAITATLNMNHIQITEAYNEGIYVSVQDCVWTDILINGVTGGRGIYIHDSGRLLVDNTQINTVHQGCISIYASFNIFFRNTYIIEDSAQTAYNCVQIGPAVTGISFIGGIIAGGGTSGGTVADYGTNTILSAIYLSAGGAANNAIIEYGTNCTYSELQIDVTGYVGNVLNGAFNTINMGTHQTITYNNVSASSSTNIHTSIAGNGALQIVTTGITQPDCPRNLYITCTNNNAPSGVMYIVGVNGYGFAINESVVLVPGSSNILTKNTFSHVTSFSIPAGVSSGDNVGLGGSNFIGVNGNARYAWQLSYVSQVASGELSYAVDGYINAPTAIHVLTALNGCALTINFYNLDIKFTGVESGLP